MSIKPSSQPIQLSRYLKYHHNGRCMKYTFIIFVLIVLIPHPDPFALHHYAAPPHCDYHNHYIDMILRIVFLLNKKQHN